MTTNTFYTNVERYGSNILWRGYENGRRFSRKVKYEPTLYLASKEATGMTAFMDSTKHVQSRTYESMSAATDFLKQYDDVAGFEVFGNPNFVSQFMQEQYPDTINFDMSLINIVSFDIEYDSSTGYSSPDKAEKQITSISYKSSRNSVYHLLTLKDYDKHKTETSIEPENIYHVKFDSEEALLLRFIQLWKNDFPDVVTGWNVEYFDIMYIITRIMKLLGESKAKELSPWGHIRLSTKEIFNRTHSTYHISGVSVIDYMEAFKKFGYKYGKQETYKLDHIAQVVLGEKKLDYSEYGTLGELYLKNPQLYLDYSLKDTYLIQRLEDESALLSLVLTIAYSGGVNYSDAFGTVGIWESILYRKMMQENKVPPAHKKPGERAALLGGYVKDPVIQMYRWIVTVDLASLYPHLMMQYNISPETYLPDTRVNITQDMVISGEFQNGMSDISVCSNGVCFTNKLHGIIPRIIKDMYASRAKIKKEMLAIEQEIQNTKDEKEKKELERVETQLHNSQMSIKIMMNSLYGALGNRYFQYYVNDIAEAITTSGQVSIKVAEKNINEYLNKILETSDIDYVIYMDTDSAFINMEPLIVKVFGTSDVDLKKAEDFLGAVCKEKLEPVIATGYKKLASQMTAYENAMIMKTEKLTNKLVLTGKKRYLASVLNNEGVHYDPPKIDVTGIESVRSSTPEICREKMQEAFTVFMTGTEEDAQKFISDFREVFYSLPAQEIAKISGTDDIEKFMDKTTIYKKGCPIHVRGSLLYNDFLEKKRLINRYEKIVSGDKVKFVYLKLPNPIRENVIAFNGDSLPKEFDIEPYIDYDTQFEKVFVKPLETILAAMGWNVEKIDTLESFFG